MASIPPANGCRCASWKPGRTVRPSSSTTRAAERPPSSAEEPTAAMRPPRTATASASPPETVCTRPPRSSRSTALGSIGVAIFSPADARRAVERGFDDGVRFLADLVRVPSLLGEEEPAQQLVEARLRDLGFEIESVSPDPERLGERPDSGIPLIPYEGRRSLVGTIGDDSGRSLVLNGHVDVVSA